MGREKALVEVAGWPMSEWVRMALEAVCSEVVVAGRIGTEQGLVDPPGVRGPLAGLRAALELGSDLLLVAVDQPWVRADTLGRLADLEGTAVPLHEGVRQVTCARYSTELAPTAAAAASIQDLLDLVDYRGVAEEEWRTWGEDGRSWFSVDDEAALHQGLARYGFP